MVAHNHTNGRKQPSGVFCVCAVIYISVTKVQETPRTNVCVCARERKRERERERDLFYRAQAHFTPGVRECGESKTKSAVHELCAVPELRETFDTGTNVR